MSTRKQPPIEAGTFYGKPLQFEPGRHRYVWGGEPIPSVTTILGRLAKPALIQWAADQTVKHIQAVGDISPEGLAVARLAHLRTKKEAAGIGTSVHTYAEARLRGDGAVAMPADEQAAAGCRAFEDWARQHDVAPIVLERRVLSARHGFAGTADFWGHIDGGLAILDFKTSSAIWPEHWLQTAAYEIAIREELGLEHADITRWIIRLDKATGAFEARSRQRSEIDTEAFTSLANVHRLMRQAEKAAA
jgi:hypothetical protein